MNIYDDTPETDPTRKTRINQHAETIDKIRTGRPYQTAHKQYRYQCANHHNPDHTIGAPCWLCNQPIDYTLKFPHPRAWTLDHAIPVKHQPNLILDSSNYRPAHFECNNHRGTDQPTSELGTPSEKW